MNTYSIDEAVPIFEELVERAIRGERIVFTRDGKDVADLTAYVPPLHPGRKERGGLQP